MLACQRGFFGENCIAKCLSNCAGCNDVTGMCEYGCLEGYTGFFCENGDFNFSYSSETNLFHNKLFAIKWQQWLYVKKLMYER